MTLHLTAALRSFADCEFDVINRIAPRFAVNAEFDCPRAKQHVLTDCFDYFVGAIGVDVLGKHDVVALVRLRCGPKLSASTADDWTGGNHSWTREPALFNCLAQ